MTAPEWKLNDDRKTATVTFPTDPPVSFQLDATRIDRLLENLGRIRAAIEPPYAPTFAPGQKVVCVRNPAWLTEPDAMLGDSILHLRDPRIGWQHYWFPKEEARKLGGLLQAQADAPPPGQSEGKPN